MATNPVLIFGAGPVLGRAPAFKGGQFKYIKAGDYQIVHTHSSKAGLLGRVAAKAAGVPVILHTVHGWSFHDWMMPFRRKLFVVLERIADKFTDVLIVVAARDIKKGLEQGIGHPSKYHLIRSAIPVEVFSQNKIL